MQPGKALARIALCLLFAALTPAAQAREPWEHDWIEVRSPHFIIASAVAEKTTIALAVDLEKFRMAAARLTNIRVFDERVPTRIYLLGKREEELGLERQFAGYFKPGMRANVAVLLASGRQTDEIIKHEYVHFLLHNRDGLSYPSWYDEGFAELMSTLSVTETKLSYGRAPPGRMESLGYGTWLPLRQLLSTRGSMSLKGQAVDMFYAQSWLLVHYLMLGRTGADFDSQSADFLRRSEAGADPVEAFEQGFGTSVDALGGELKRYARKSQYAVFGLKRPFPTVATSTRSLPTDEIAATLGGIVLGEDFAKAGRYFTAALAANPDNARALVGQGDVLKSSGRFDEAVAFYERAIALEPANAEHELDYAEYFLDRAHKEFGPGTGEGLLVEARRHFFRSARLAPENPETLALNGVSYLFPGEDPAKAVSSLEAASNLLPSNEQIRAMLAQAYLAVGDHEAARRELMRLVAWSHPETAARIRELLAELETPDEAAPAAQAAP